MEIATAFVTIRPQTDGFESELAAAVGGIEQPVTLTAEADIADAEAEIDSLDGAPVEVPVDADVDAAQGEMDAWMASYFQVEVSVDADVDTAQQEIDSIEGGDVTVTVNTEGTEQAKDQIDNLAGSTGQLGEVAQGAMGGMSGLGGAAGGAAQALGTTAVGVGVLAVGVYEVAQAGIEAESAMQRFEFVTGNLGDSVSSIDVGGLSGDIGELALKIGSSDEAMLNATASFVQFAQSSGAADDQIVQASDNINALALRAAAMNPALGDAGEVSGRLAAALARGGRATRQFGIDVSTAEINARALSNTGKQNAADLTQFERAAAGAQIAVERLGTSMGADFQEGSENAALKWQRMTESFGELQEVAGGKMLPFVEDVTSAITKLNEGIQDFDLSDIASSLLDLSGPGMAVNELFNFPEIFGWGDSAATAAGQVSQLPPALRDAAAAADEASGETDYFGEAAGRAADDVNGLSDALHSYFQGAFSIPEAQRELRESFEDLFRVLLTQGHTADDVAAALEGIAYSTADLGAATGDFGGAATLTIQRLRGMRDSGAITADEFDRIRDAIRGAQEQGPVETQTSAPGALQARAQVDGLHGALAAIPRVTRATVVVDAVTSGIDAAAAAINGLRDNAARGIVVTSHTPKDAAPAGAFTGGQYLGTGVAGLSERIGAVATEMGRALGRGASTAAPLSPITLQVDLDGRVVAERVFAIDHQRGIAEGFEQ